ncbi:MAG: zinc-dependent metalloprotease family protein [Pirellulales bacterium]
MTGTTQNPRPTGDLGTILNTATLASGILDPDPKVLNVFLVRIVPGFNQTSDNTSNGLANVGSNGLAYWAGPNLPGFTGGQEVLASVLAHEIGHNLGLNHAVISENLMQAGGSANPGQRLTPAQISAVLSSQFVTALPIPEPSTYTIFAVGVAAFIWKRRRGVELVASQAA